MDAERPGHMKAKPATAMPQPPTADPKRQRLVRRVDRSPMNPLRWRLELECGHEEWVTSKRRPIAKTRRCRPCEGIHGKYAERQRSATPHRDMSNPNFATSDAERQALRRRAKRLMKKPTMQSRRSRSATRRNHTCPTCGQDMREEPHPGLNGKDCPQCGQGMSWRRVKRKTANDQDQPRPTAI